MEDHLLRWSDALTDVPYEKDITLEDCVCVLYLSALDLSDTTAGDMSSPPDVVPTAEALLDSLPRLDKSFGAILIGTYITLV